MDIQAPLFTLAELCRATGLERSTANMWLRRDQIRPTRTEKLTERKRALFSAFAIFRVKLMHTMTAHLAMGPSETIDFTKEIADAMYSVARESDRGRTLALLAAVSKKGDRWDVIFPVTKADSFPEKFGSQTPFAMVPVGEIFADVYRECQKIYEGSATDER